MSVHYPAGIKPCGQPIKTKKRVIESAANRGMDLILLWLNWLSIN